MHERKTIYTDNTFLNPKVHYLDVDFARENPPAIVRRTALAAELLIDETDPETIGAVCKSFNLEPKRMVLILKGPVPANKIIRYFRLKPTRSRK